MSELRPRSLPDLTDIQQLNDGGAVSLIGLRYQYHIAVGLCLKMLQNPNHIEYVVCELQEDVAVKLANGSYKFYQAKLKNDGLWTISLLHAEGVWQRFWYLRDCFGSGHIYGFVSDQHCQLKINGKPDLKRIKYLTDKGFNRCTPIEHIEADGIIARLMSMLQITDKGTVAELFWSLRIMTGMEHINGQIALNLTELENLLLSRGIDSDPVNRVRIYRAIVSVFEEKIAEPPAEMTMQERLEYRKVRDEDVEACITGPYKEVRPSQFNITHTDTQVKTLTSKMQDAQFPDRLLRFVIESRNQFSLRYRRDRIHAGAYLTQLRWEIWKICIDHSRLPAHEYVAIKTYNAIWNELYLLAQREASCNPPIAVDFDYLHGMLCQLTAECDNEWRPIG